jgi:hypothetical protein
VREEKSKKLARIQEWFNYTIFNVKFTVPKRKKKT